VIAACDIRCCAIFGSPSRQLTKRVTSLRACVVNESNEGEQPGSFRMSLTIGACRYFDFFAAFRRPRHAHGSYFSFGSGIFSSAAL